MASATPQLTGGSVSGANVTKGGASFASSIRAATAGSGVFIDGAGNITYDIPDLSDAQAVTRIAISMKMQTDATSSSINRASSVEVVGSSLAAAVLHTTTAGNADGAASTVTNNFDGSWTQAEYNAMTMKFAATGDIEAAEQATFFALSITVTYTQSATGTVVRKVLHLGNRISL